MLRLTCSEENLSARYQLPAVIWAAQLQAYPLMGPWWVPAPATGLTHGWAKGAAALRGTVNLSRRPAR